MLQSDPKLKEKLKSAADLDSALAIVTAAGLDVSKADLLKYQSTQGVELSEEDLETVAGGGVCFYCAYSNSMADDW